MSRVSEKDKPEGCCSCADNPRVDLETLSIKIARSENLPVLPQVATAVLRMAEDPNSSSRNIEKLIERDPALAAKTLRVANSSYYGLSNVSTIARAISILGLNTIRSLVISVSYQQMLSGRVTAKNFDKFAFWCHSLGVATASRIIGKMLLPEKSEELYIAGMMHDVGFLVLDRFIPDELDEAIRISRDRGVPVHLVERELYGYDHGDVGGILADKWGLPKTLGAAVRCHHDVSADPDMLFTNSIVCVADFLVHSVGLDNAMPSAEAIDKLAERTHCLPEQQLKFVSEVTINEVTRAHSAFTVPLAA